MSNSIPKMNTGTELGEAVLQSLTMEMVRELIAKIVAAVELMDEILQPETVALLRRLPDVSNSLSRVLTEVQRLEENGTLKILQEFGEMLAKMKDSMTGPMVTDMIAPAVKAVELADSLVQKGALELVESMLSAFESAKKECQKANQPLSLFQMFRAMSDPEVREGIRLFLSFAKTLPKELNKKS